MWPFRKRAQDTPGDAPPSSDAGSIQRVSEGGARSSATVVRPTPVEPGWSSLAPLATCVQPMRTTIDTDAFTASLASHSPPTFLSPLSHAVAADAPSGEVNGLASVTTRRATVADPRPLDLPVVARSDASVTGSLQRFANPFGSPIAVASPAPVPVPAATVAPSGADSHATW